MKFILIVMNMKKLSLVLLPIMAVASLSGCGQAGDLYLPDDLRAEKLEQQATKASSAKAKQLREEAARLRQRHQEMAELRTRLSGLEQEESALRESKKVEEADEALKEINKIRYRLGKLILEQHRVQ